MNALEYPNNNVQAMPITGVVRQLDANDRALFADHLKRLDHIDRHERFNGSVNDSVVEAYASHALSQDSLSFGYIEYGVIRGACEVRPTGGNGAYEADLAFSIESDWKRRGIGSRLLARALRVSEQKEFGRIGFTTDPQNTAMKALARKFGAELQFADGQTIGVFREKAADSGRDDEIGIPASLQDSPEIASGVAQLFAGLRDLAGAGFPRF